MPKKSKTGRFFAKKMTKIKIPLHRRSAEKLESRKRYFCLFVCLVVFISEIQFPRIPTYYLKILYPTRHFLALFGEHILFSTQSFVRQHPLIRLIRPRCCLVFFPRKKKPAFSRQPLARKIKSQTYFLKSPSCSTAPTHTTVPLPCLALSPSAE